jgi:hypothetical protein
MLALPIAAMLGAILWAVFDALRREARYKGWVITLLDAAGPWGVAAALFVWIGLGIYLVGPLP